MRTEFQSNISVKPELAERLRRCITVVVDLDGTLFPGPDVLTDQVAQLGAKKNIIPCTTRSWGEMLIKDYLAKETLIQTGYGIFEAGLVLKKPQGLEITCKREDLAGLSQLKQLINNSITYRGPRITGQYYELQDDPLNQNAFGYLASSLGEEYIAERCVPVKIPEYDNQYSLVIWPSGSARNCPLERFFYQVCIFIDGLRAANPDLFKNLHILIGDESVVVRPKDLDGRPITKLTGIQALEKDQVLFASRSIFIGDDDNLDLPVAQYFRNKGGVVIAPKNAGRRIKQIADINLDQDAGFGVSNFLNSINTNIW